MSHEIYFCPCLLQSGIASSLITVAEVVGCETHPDSCDAFLFKVLYGGRLTTQCVIISADT